MTAKTLMILGTHSNAGKSVMVAALCRIFARRGLRVVPFKAQNMALNAAVTPDGDEIGRATFAQAEAAQATPHVDMNPILLKPEADHRSQIILNGKAHSHIHAGNWHSIKPFLWGNVTAALDRLRARTDLVIIEGAGSPAEINLKESDIVNIRVAQYANAPALLVGDIDRGGVFAALVGTLVLLEPDERAHIKGFLINKFRGDISLLGDGLQMLQKRAFDTPTIGVIPFLPDIGIAEEDAVPLENPALDTDETPIDIAVIALPHISNFDDFDPLQAETSVRVRFVRRPANLGAPSAIILPGTKTTLEDLRWMRKIGWDEKLIGYARNGGHVSGICGGYQLLGQNLCDPDGIESAPNSHIEGLGLLPLETTFGGDKRTVQVSGRLIAPTADFAPLQGSPIRGYEIHIGKSTSTADARPLCEISTGNARHTDGIITDDGRIWGTYLHGIFENDAFRHAWLSALGWREKGKIFDRDAAYNRLADHVESHLDMALLEKIIGL